MIRGALFTLAIIAGAGLLYTRVTRTVPTDISGFARVIDGDTIVIGTRHIRLAAIDAPEAAQSCTDAVRGGWPCGRFATEVLTGLVKDARVTCRDRGLDRYGRTLATCEVNGGDIGEVMVRNGAAVDYLRYDPTGIYAAAEREARDAKRGIWSGDFEMPEAWRARHRR